MKSIFLSALLLAPSAFAIEAGVYNCQLKYEGILSEEYSVSVLFSDLGVGQAVPYVAVNHHGGKNDFFNSLRPGVIKGLARTEEFSAEGSDGKLHKFEAISLPGLSHDLVGTIDGALISTVQPEKVGLPVCHKL